MSVPQLFISDLTPEEAAAGFEVRQVRHPDGLPATVTVAVLTWGDASHRLVKTRGRDGIVFQLQAFGRRRARVGPDGWYAERYWPSQYGLGWVLDRLREHLGRTRYAALIELHVPPAEEAVSGPPAPAGPVGFAAAAG